MDYALQNRRNVMNSTNRSKGVNRYVVEEVYNSQACFNSVDGKKGNNPQGAYYEDGKYYFDFPSIWYNSNSVNKAIGLRYIEILPRSFNLEYTVRFKYTDELDTNVHSANFVYTVNPNDTIEEVIYGMCKQISTLLTAEDRKHIEFIPLYDADYNVLIMMRYTFFENYPTLEDFEITNTNKDFDSFFGGTFKSYGREDKALRVVHKYTGVWNRRELFLHASFVNYTSFNYLGKDGEYYDHISKIYDVAYAPQKFYIELSFDGMNPIKTEQVDFLIGLCFITDDKKYNGK